jgi:two-component system cell cycle response regulator
MIRPTCSVLLVEDVPLLAKVTEQMLKKSPANRYTMVHRSSLAEAKAALKDGEFDVILLDLNLTDSVELGTLTAVLEAAPDVPIVVMTATQNHAVGFQAIKLGAQDFLMKGDFNYLILDRAIVYSIERHRLRRTIQQLAVIDELTGLYNRRGFHTLYPDIVHRVKQSKARGYLCFFDLDRFKQINDEQGHQKGDEALVEFATTLRGAFRKDTLLVRLGGDEFVALGVESEAGQAEGWLQTLQVVLNVRNQTHGSSFALEASCGVVYFDQAGPHGIEELTAAADAALYRDKESRRQARAPAGGRFQEARS